MFCMFGCVFIGMRVLLTDGLMLVLNVETVVLTKQVQACKLVPHSEKIKCVGGGI